MKQLFAVALLLAACSASPEAPGVDEAVVDAVFSEQSLPVEWRAFTKLNTVYFCR